MADLPNSSFTAVNDVETAQGAPVSEAIAQKYGSNENYLDAQRATNTANIATNTANIATNTSNIAALKQPETFDVTLNPNAGFQTVFNFSATPTIVFITVGGLTNVFSDKLLTQAISGSEVGWSDGTNILRLKLTGTLLEVKEQTGSVGLIQFIGAGWV